MRITIDYNVDRDEVSLMCEVDDNSCAESCINFITHKAQSVSVCFEQDGEATETVIPVENCSACYVLPDEAMRAAGEFTVCADGCTAIRFIVEAAIPTGAEYSISLTNGVFYVRSSAGSASSYVLPIEEGGTGSTNAADARTALEITPANIGAVKKSGDTMTGDLSIAKATPQLFLRDAESGVRGAIQGIANTSNANTTMRFAARGKGTSYYEYYALPYANNDLTANKYYSLLTTKAVVTVAQGGTGNTTGLAASATKLANARTIRTNLGSTSTASFDGTENVAPGVTGTLPVANGGTGATTAAAARTNLGLDKVTLWSGTGTAGTTITLKESIDNFKFLAVLISNSNSDVLSWTSDRTTAMFSRNAIGGDDTEGFGTYVARLEVDASDRTSVTVADTRYVRHRSSSHSINTSLGAISAVYGWR